MSADVLTPQPDDTSPQEVVRNVDGKEHREYLAPRIDPTLAVNAAMLSNNP